MRISQSFIKPNGILKISAQTYITCVVQWLLYVDFVSMARVRFPVSTNIIFLYFPHFNAAPNNIQSTHIHTGKEILWVGFCNVLVTLHLTYRTALLSSETPILPTDNIVYGRFGSLRVKQQRKGIFWLEFCSVLDTPHLT